MVKKFFTKGVFTWFEVSCIIISISIREALNYEHNWQNLLYAIVAGLTIGTISGIIRSIEYIKEESDEESI